MTDHGLLLPGLVRTGNAFDDRAVATAMVRVEAAWVAALADVGAIDVAQAKRIVAVIAEWSPDLSALGADTEDAGNPVVPLVRQLRALFGPTDARVIHRGLTSQDVLDTALVLLSREALTRVQADIVAGSRALAQLADRHRDSVMAGRTLTQYAVPITFGLKAAQWLGGLLDAASDLEAAAGSLPVQCGGAAGTLALAAELTDDPIALAGAFADELGLIWPGLPWHTNRRPITRIADALITCCDAFGVIASDIVTLSRPEIAEVQEAAVPGRGGSSTMPHKHNPILSVLIRSTAMTAPHLGTQLHLAAAFAVDERPDGAWHSEWAALRNLLERAVTAASQTAELVTGLQVDAERMRRRAESASTDLLAERGQSDGENGDAVADYLGATSALIDVVLARVPTGRPDHG